MRPRLARRPSPGTALGAIALIVALGGVGIAAIPGKDGVVSACYSKKTGAVRLIDKAKSQKCKKGEKKASWNQKGATGPPGPPGPTGAKGDTGVAGTNGENGIDGSPGQAGSSGPGILFTTGSVNDSTATYLSLGGAASVDPGGENAAQTGTPPGASLTARDMSVRTKSNVATGTVEVNFRVNGVSKLTCTIPAGQQTCSSTQTVTLQPGDLINYRTVASGAASVNTANYAVRIVF